MTPLSCIFIVSAGGMCQTAAGHPPCWTSSRSRHARWRKRNVVRLLRNRWKCRCRQLPCGATATRAPPLGPRKALGATRLASGMSLSSNSNRSSLSRRTAKTTSRHRCLSLTLLSVRSPLHLCSHVNNAHFPALNSSSQGSNQAPTSKSRTSKGKKEEVRVSLFSDLSRIPVPFL